MWTATPGPATPAARSPPWLWLFVALYLWRLPDTVGHWRVLVDDLRGRYDVPPELLGSDLGWLLRLLSAVELVPAVMLG